MINFSLGFEAECNRLLLQCIDLRSELGEVIQSLT